MSVINQINNYIASQPEAKRLDMQALHELIIKIVPNGTLWFLDGKNETQKVVANPNIGYGTLTLTYADGSTKTFYKIGLSANTTGISVYLMGIPDKNYLAQNFAPKIGKASVTGYCIKFKKLSDIDLPTLTEAISYCAQL
jgi:hypothetical protein